MFSSAYFISYSFENNHGISPGINTRLILGKSVEERDSGTWQKGLSCHFYKNR